MSVLHVKYIKIENVKAIKNLEFQPGTITVISGRNQSGKTSVLDAVRTIFDGGHDPALIRRGEKAGKVTLVLSDGTTVTKSITQKTSRLEVLQPDGKRVDGGDKTYLDSLATALAVDPAKLLNPALKPQDIAKALLDTLGIEFTYAEIRARTTTDPDPIKQVYTLDDLAKVRAALYEQRRRTNVADRDKEGIINGLRRALPSSKPVDIRDAMQVTQARLAKLEELTRAELEKVAAKEKEELNAMREEYDKRLSELEKWKAEQWASIEERATTQRKEIEQQARPARESLQAEIAQQREQLESWARANAIEEQINQHVMEKMVLVTTSSQLTQAIEELDKLKMERLRSLPIPGLTYEDGMFFVDGIPWEHVNSATRTQYACMIAARKAGPLRMLCIDDAEHLDPDSQSALEAWAHSNGFQIIAASVDDVVGLEVVT